MRMPRRVLIVAAIALIAVAPASAQYQARYGVMGCGGGRMASVNNSFMGTTGQPGIGPMGGPDYSTEIGFWYMPGWVLTGIVDEENLVPVSFGFGQCHPNPFNPVTTLGFAVPRRARVEIRVFDVAGREVMTLIDREIDPGYHQAALDGAGLPSGVYFARMVSGEFVETRKMVLLK